MIYILTSEDRRKLKEALKHALNHLDIGRFTEENQVATSMRVESALSLLAGLPKVQDRGTHSMDPLRLREVQRAAKRYEWLRAGNYAIDFARAVLNDTPHGIDAAIDAAMKEHP